MTSHTVSVHFDWSKCIFCQKVTRSSKINCPAYSKRSDADSGYKSLAEAIGGFKELNQLPKNINLTALDEGDGIEATCHRNRACWHIKCRGMVLHPNKLNRMHKQSSITDHTRENSSSGSSSS